MQRLDVRGTLLLGGAVFLGIWGIVHGNDDGWGIAAVLLPLVLAVLLVPAYVCTPARRHAVTSPCCRCGCSVPVDSPSRTWSG